MRFGAHLPLIGFDDVGFSLDLLERYAKTAEEAGYETLSANDHLVFSRPWLDGLTALAACVGFTRRITLGTSVALAVVRHPVPLARALGAIDVLSGGRLRVGVGPGSSPRDYALVGVPFEERWKRLDEAVQVMRAVWRGEPARGAFYTFEDVDLEPRPSTPGGPPLWIGSWGSAAGLKRVARLADGWLASAYNTTPATFAQAWQQLRSLVSESKTSGSAFPNALATMWTYVSDDASAARRVLRESVAAMVKRPVESLENLLTIGPPEACAQILSAYRDAGVQEVLIWPVRDPVRQLTVFMERVAPMV